MPILFEPSPDPTTRYVVICQPALKYDAETAEFRSRYVVLFLLGHFTLNEASQFAIDMFDSGIVPDGTSYFNDLPSIQSVGFSNTAAVPVELQHLIDNFSVMVFLDEYTFFLMSHMVAYYFKTTLNHR
jgi:hypothetical protein